MKKVHFLITGVILAIGITALWTFVLLKPRMQNSDAQILSLSAHSTPVPTEAEATGVKADPTTPSPVQKTKSVTIALFGDSMVDTMGDKLEILDEVLSKRYPSYSFSLYNYGIGAQNVSQGLSRFDSPYSYKERNFPPVSQLKPDVLIIGTFSYNPFDPHDPQKHKQELSALLTKAKAASSEVYLLVEIAPLSWEFGKGEKGINWPDDVSEAHAAKIREQLRSSLALATELGIPVIDVFTPSSINDTQGNPTYVSPEDGIHPSYQGHVFTAERIASRLNLD